MRRVVGELIFSTPRSWKLQEIAQRVMDGPRLVTVPLRGQPFACLTSEKYFWFREDYEAEFRNELENALTSDSVFYDVGANVGFWPVMLGKRCRQVFAFEPSPTNFSRLLANVKGLNNVTAVNCAVSERAGTLHFAENGTMSAVTDDGPCKVPTIRLDDFIELHPAPHVIKIDIEGHGAKCLAGMPQIISNSRLVIFMEVHNTEEESGVANFLSRYNVVTYNSTRFPYHIRATR